MELKTVHIEGNYSGDLAYALWRPETSFKGNVVCAHGLSRQKRDFDYIAEFLSQKGYQVYAVDAPGRGGSMRFADPGLYNLDVYADVFETFLKHLDMTNVHWIGTSMGGLIAMRMAALGYAGRFKTVTLVDITHKPNFAACERIASYMTEAPPVLPDIDGYIDFLMLNLPLGNVPESVWRHYAEHQLVKTGQGYIFHFDAKIARLAMKELRKPINLSEGLKKINCPLALVAGGVSDLCTRVEIDEFLKVKPDARLHICPEAGHVPALTDADTQEFILETLARAEAKT